MTTLRSARALAALAASVLGALAVLLPAAPAAAHVLLAEAQPNGDGTTNLTFTFDHGCGEAPTTELAVSLPAGVSVAGASGPDGWDAEVAGGQVTWTGPGIDSGAEARFAAVARITGTAGQTFLFPTRQSCDNGESYEWFDSEPGDEYPAPTLVATGAVLTNPAVAAPGGGASGATVAQTLVAVAGLVAAAAAGAAFLTRPRAAGVFTISRSSS